MSVSIVGAGPGDPGLLTLRAAELLRSADVVLHDALVTDEVLALVPPACERIDAGKRCGVVRMTQAQIVAVMCERVRSGARVVRLKGGDPFVFGRGGEEVQALLAAGFACEVVPGVSSALAAPAYAGIPLTHRGVSASFVVVTGHEDPDKPRTQIDWRHLARFDGTIVVLMGLRATASIATLLIANGMPAETPVCAIENGTRASQRNVEGTLATIGARVDAARLRGPVAIVIGRVASLRGALNWAATWSRQDV